MNEIRFMHSIVSYGFVLVNMCQTYDEYHSKFIDEIQHIMVSGKKLHRTYQV